jgi:hypothetical protein
MDKITVAEEEAMVRWIKWYADERFNLSMSEVLQCWNINKANLARAFGDKLILSKEISFKAGEEELIEQMTECLFSATSKAAPFVRAFQQLTCRGGMCEYNYDLSSLLYVENLITNIYDDNDFVLDLPDGKKLTINRGCKISKMLGKIAKAFNLPMYEEFRILHSQALNQKYLKGTLCLSIHPLDYMTMSDNDCGWESCMSWANNGEYRRGTIEMMNSPYIVVAYLSAESPFQIGSFKWSNKKWRELFFVSSDIITGIKPYPYENQYIEESVCSWLKELMTNNLGCSYFNDLTFYLPRSGINLNGDSFSIAFYTDAMYNDFGARSEHMAYVGTQAPKHMEYAYSGPSVCLLCGQTHTDYDTEQELVCCECNHYRKCAECGDRVHVDDLYMHGDDYLCEYCYETMTSACSLCEETHFNDSCYDIYLALRAPTDNTLAQLVFYNSITVCERCTDKLTYCANNPTSHLQKNNADDFVAKIYHTTDSYKPYYFIFADECTPKLLQLFGYEDITDVHILPCDVWNYHFQN